MRCPMAIFRHAGRRAPEGSITAVSASDAVIANSVRANPRASSLASQSPTPPSAGTRLITYSHHRVGYRLNSIIIPTYDILARIVPLCGILVIAGSLGQRIYPPSAFF